mmetsp:Transcript_28368/g.76860  ORF Transcript_28368/g.76860 Transcript_28368/m.76860 type:complete len:321 (+) Transcript_28368:437-1399(+)
MKESIQQMKVPQKAVGNDRCQHDGALKGEENRNGWSVCRDVLAAHYDRKNIQYLQETDQGEQFDVRQPHADPSRGRIHHHYFFRHAQMGLSGIDNVMQALGQDQEQKEHKGLDVELGSKNRQRQARFGNVPPKKVGETLRFVQPQSVEEEIRCDLEQPNQKCNKGISKYHIGVFARAQKNQGKVPLLSRSVGVINQCNRRPKTQSHVCKWVLLWWTILEIDIVVHQIVLPKSRITVPDFAVFVGKALLRISVDTVQEVCANRIINNPLIVIHICFFVLVFLGQKHLFHGFFSPALQFCGIIVSSSLRIVVCETLRILHGF